MHEKMLQNLSGHVMVYPDAIPLIFCCKKLPTR
ncbi:Uncharacterised protein [Salmonella enterica subsp. arizonae]|uniref:Uncharacterized protein n=1 Tax=Salmonella enterica subsp. arizonae TaxID=59203 RepID=A0A379TAV2_SALER|nr:Uncharacterised protein [Salmonella enterica subsp. arizonae]SUG47501.1 Uncharacterised protein [Salmonella enterica subsp. arizonae]